MRNHRLGIVAACTVVASGALLLLGPTLASPVSAKRQSAGPMETWEYRVVRISAIESLGVTNSLEAIAKVRSDAGARASVEKSLHDQLNALGRDGWEMIDTDRQGTFWFKRRTH